MTGTEEFAHRFITATAAGDLDTVAAMYAQRHILHVVVPARGEQAEQALAVPACLVVRVEEDRITRLDEYLDSAQVAPLFGG